MVLQFDSASPQNEFFKKKENQHCTQKIEQFLLTNIDRYRAVLRSIGNLKNAFLLRVRRFCKIYIEHSMGKLDLSDKSRTIFAYIFKNFGFLKNYTKYLISIYKSHIFLTIWVFHFLTQFFFSNSFKGTAELNTGSKTRIKNNDSKKCKSYKQSMLAKDSCAFNTYSYLLISSNIISSESTLNKRLSLSKFAEKSNLVFYNYCEYFSNNFIRFWNFLLIIED